MTKIHCSPSVTPTTAAPTPSESQTVSPSPTVLPTATSSSYSGPTLVDSHNPVFHQATCEHPASIDFAHDDIAYTIDGQVMPAGHDQLIVFGKPVVGPFLVTAYIRGDVGITDGVINGNVYWNFTVVVPECKPIIIPPPITLHHGKPPVHKHVPGPVVTTHKPVITTSATVASVNHTPQAPATSGLASTGAMPLIALVLGISITAIGSALNRIGQRRH